MRCFAFVLSAFAVGALQAATTWYVDAANYGKSGLDGTTPETAFGTIQDAVDNALCVAGDTVSVLPGVYNQGGYSDSGRMSRVYVTKSIVIQASDADPSKTVISGRWDSNFANGIGPDAVRCVAASGGAIVRGFTLRDGAAHTTETGKHSYSGGFRAVVSDSKADGSAYLVDCVVTNCTASRGPAMFGGTALRCRLVDNVGGGVRQARLINCLLTGTTGGNVTFACRLYNTTIVNNDDYGVRGTSKVWNCAIQFNASGSSAASDEHEVYNSLVIPWNSTKTTPTDSVTGSTDRVFFSPATRDFHPVADTDIDGLGSASFLSALDPALPPGLDAFVDLDGVAIATSGAIQPGAFQTCANPLTASGAIVFDTSAIVNGTPVYKNGLYCRTAGGPGEILLSAKVPDGRAFVGFKCAEMAGAAVYPQMDDTVWTMTPTNNPAGDCQVDYETVVAAADHVFHVNPDPAVGSDDNDGRTAATPFLTLTNAVAKIGALKNPGAGSVIYAAPGVYTNGAFSSSYGFFRLYNDSISYLRLKGAGANLSFIYGAKATGTEANEDGRGEDAVRCCYLNRSMCVQGFTLGNSYSKVGSSNDHPYKGGIVCAPSASCYAQVTDCVLTNGWAYRAGVACNTTMRRCVITGANMSTGSGQSQLRSCNLSSCLFVRNPGADALIFGDNDVQGCTVITDTGAKAMTSGCVPRNSIVYVPSGTDLPKATTGCVVSRSFDDIVFVDERTGDWRVTDRSPAVGCGVAPNFAIYSSDLTGRPLSWMNGQPTAGAYQDVPAYDPNLYVDPVNGDDAASGRDATHPVRRLKTMLEDRCLRAGDTVNLAAGTYDGTYGAQEDEFFLYPASGTQYKYRLVVPANITIRGAGAERTILDARGTAEDPVRGAYVSAGATLQGVTICGGYSAVNNDQAAGFRADNSGSLVNCIISNNYNAVDNGTSAGNGGRLYGCVIDHNRGKYTGYSIYRIENCTFGPDNKQLNGTSAADLTRGNTYAIVNSILCGGTVTTKEYTAITNTVFTRASTSYPAMEVGCLHTNADAIALQADYTLGAGSVARDLCRDAGVSELLEEDVFCGQRVYNGFADAGAVEYDCRGEYAAFLGGEACVVSKASPEVVLADGRLAVGGTVDFTLAKGKEGVEKFAFPVCVAGTGRLNVSLNGQPYAAYTHEDGEKKLTFSNDQELNRLAVAYEPGETDSDVAYLGSRLLPTGLLLMFR